MTILQCLSATDSETEEEVEYSYHAGVSLSPMGQPLATPLSQPKITSSTPIIHALHTDSTQIAADNPVQQGNIHQNTIDKNKHTPSPTYIPMTKSQTMKASINKNSLKPSLFVRLLVMTWGYVGILSKTLVLTFRLRILSPTHFSLSKFKTYKKSSKE